MIIWRIIWALTNQNYFIKTETSAHNKYPITLAPITQSGNEAPPPKQIHSELTPLKGQHARGHGSSGLDIIFHI